MLDSLALRANLRLVPIGELVERVSTRDPTKAAPGESFVYIDLSAVDQEEKKITAARIILNQDAPSRARQIVQRGDVLISTVRPNLNGVARVTRSYEGATASTGFCVLRSRQDELDSGFLFHWVITTPFVNNMVSKATGASYPAISDEIVRRSLLPLPPIAEQRRIAAILDQADALRAKRRAALAQLDEMASAIFVEMFGDSSADDRPWSVSKLGDLISDGPQNGLYKPADAYGDGTRIPSELTHFTTEW